MRLGRWLLPPLTDDAPEPAAKTFAGKARGIWDRYLWSAHETPARRAAAVGVGVFCSIFPVWGAQMLLALLLARVLRLNRVLTLAASNFSLPPMIPLIVYAALMTGQLALTGRWTWVIPFGGLTAAAMRKYFLEFIVGSSLLAAGAGLLAWAASYAVLRWVLRPGAKP